MVHWEHEDGIRLQAFDGVGGPRYLRLPDGRGRLHCFASESGAGGPGSGVRISQSLVSAVTSDGLSFELEPGYRMRDRQSEYDTAGITAAEVIAPAVDADKWTMFFSAWQDVPPGTVVPLHPSQDADAVASGRSEDFAAASIAADMAGYRSRILVASSHDGLTWDRGGCAIEGGRYRMYYAACDTNGHWVIASAVTADVTAR
jgi:hypothetical protein